jgi:hypothetical protein
VDFEGSWCWGGHGDGNGNGDDDGGEAEVEGIDRLVRRTPEDLNIFDRRMSIHSDLTTIRKFLTYILERTVWCV